MFVRIAIALSVFAFTMLTTMVLHHLLYALFHTDLPFWVITLFTLIIAGPISVWFAAPVIILRKKP